MSRKRETCCKGCGAVKTALNCATYTNTHGKKYLVYKCASCVAKQSRERRWDRMPTSALWDLVDKHKIASNQLTRYIYEMRTI